MELDHLMDLYVDELKDVYNAEQQILRALPKMASSAKHAELRTAFENHEAMTQEQVKRLDIIFDELKQSPAGKKCLGMEGLIKEGEEMMSESVDPDVRDAAMISNAQRVEHYEIAAYGTLRTYANQLGLKDHARLLQTTLDEEGNTDKLLTRIAEQRVNRDAEVR
ncbi:MAG: ferritin-like domain-containing protein [Gemmatimonadota bacterium]